MLHSAYLDDDDILLSEEYNKMYSKKNVQWTFKTVRGVFSFNYDS
jgi:16S rRNA G1207 methylase RsmC